MFCNKIFVKFCNTFTKIFVIFVGFFCLFGCTKNYDTYKNSIYFKDNFSTPVPTISAMANTVQLAKTVTPAVVAIASAVGNGQNIGSGVCVKSGGYILTNEHVVSGASNIKLYLHNNTSTSAIVLWRDSVMDIAILKSQKAIPYLQLANNEHSVVGEDVVAVGTPLSLNFTHTFTKGIISALNRTIKINTSAGEALMQNLIQHDASINPGNSGGPLINARGEVVGINTLKISTAEGLGFAIPIDSVVSIIENVYDNYKTPYLGVYGYDVSNEAFFGDNSPYEGFYVLNVAKGSPADSVGIKENDIIVKINNNKISNALDFRKHLYRHGVNQKINITYLRDDKQLNCNILLTQHPHANRSVEADTN